MRTHKVQVSIAKRLVVALSLAIFPAVALAGPSQATTLTVLNSVSNSWRAIASSADGTKLVAAPFGVDNIYTSSDSGGTWTKQAGSAVKYYTSIASSTDGQTLAAVASDGFVYISTDSGVTWVNHNLSASPLFASQLRTVVMSGDGTHLAVADVATGSASGGDLYTSTDLGSTWIRDHNSSDPSWLGLTMSTDGLTMYAIPYGTDAYPVIKGSYSASAWHWNTTTSGSHTWKTIVASSDASKIVATSTLGIYYSTDSGSTWTLAPSTTSLTGPVSVASDGVHFVAIDPSSGGAIYSSNPSLSSWTQVSSTGITGKSWGSVVSASSDGSKWIVGTYSAGFIYKLDINGVPLSTIATLTLASTVKGQAVSSLGTPSSSLGAGTTGSVTITSAKASDTSESGSFMTNFVKTDSGATINKVVKYAFGAATTNFGTTDSAYTGGAIANNDLFVIKVTAADGTTVLYYRIYVVVTTTVSTDATLSVSSTVKGQALISLGTPNASLSSSFAAGSVTLTAAKGADTSGTGSYVTSFAKTDSGATVNRVVKYAAGASISDFATDPTYANGAISNGDFFIVKVTAADGSTVLYYKIVVSVTAPATTSTLNSLTISSGSDALSPSFSSGIHSYTTTVANDVDSITVTASFSGVGETVQINSNSVSSGVPSGSLSLTVGTPRVVPILATAQDGSTTTYMLTVTRAGAPISSWTKGGVAGAGNKNWFGVASSTDGSHLAAVVNAGYIYTSSDHGNTWVEQTSSGSRNWILIASDSTGQHLSATESTGRIYTSVDWGATWSVGTNSPTGTSGTPLYGIASSSDGSTLASTVYGGFIYKSTTSGSSWDSTTAGSANPSTGVGPQNWRGIASSADGQKLLAANTGGISGGLYTSTDGGVTWVQHIIESPATHEWLSVTSSSDGTVLAAVDSSTNGTGVGYIWRSTDSGLTWQEITSAGAHAWWGISISGDGTKLAATYRTTAPVAGGILVSYTSGQSWSKISDGVLSWGRDFRFVSVSGDGQQILADVPNGDLYVTSMPTIATPVISIASTSESATASTAIAGLTITSTGGSIDNFTISPAIGNGLSFNNSTGAITGTPSSAAPLVTYTITAWNGGGSASVTYSIEVAAAPTPPSSPSPTSTPDPAQTSSVTPPSTTGSGSVSGGNGYAVTGSFIAPIANITVDSHPLPSGSWIQTPSAVTITMPPHSEGTVLIQIYNGQVPLLAPIPYVYSKSAASTSVPAPTPTPVPATGPTGTGTGATVKPAPMPTPTPSSTTAARSGKPASDNSAAKSPVISFGNAQYRLAASQQALLKQFNISPTSTLVLTGYASNTKGGDNLRISLDRALEVKSALLKLYPKLNITVKGLGTAPNPICNSAQNRCVVIQKSQG